MNLLSIGFRSVLEKDEVILKVFRRRSIVALILVVFFLGIWGMIAWFLWQHFGQDSFWWSASLFLVAFYWASVFFNRWYLNAILMTTDNLIIVEWVRYFHKKAFIVSYWNLDEPQIEQQGIRSFIRNEGDVTFLKIQSGTGHTFKHLHRPHKVIKEIHEMKEKQLHEKNFKEESALKNLISQMVQGHVRKNGVPDADEELNFPRKKLKNKTPIYYGDENIEYEKELDDFGGIEIDLTEERD